MRQSVSKLLRKFASVGDYNYRRLKRDWLRIPRVNRSEVRRNIEKQV